jgi:hypothetical protein
MISATHCALTMLRFASVPSDGYNAGPLRRGIRVIQSPDCY